MYVLVVTRTFSMIIPLPFNIIDFNSCSFEFEALAIDLPLVPFLIVHTCAELKLFQMWTMIILIFLLFYDIGAFNINQKKGKQRTDNLSFVSRTCRAVCATLKASASSEKTNPTMVMYTQRLDT